MNKQNAEEKKKKQHTLTHCHNKIPIFDIQHI